jgi:UV DNA damage repair endonuclease
MSINLGYACINMYLSETEKNTPARTCRKATFLAKGLPHVGMLFETNINNLLRILEWNSKNGFIDYCSWCSSCST